MKPSQILSVLALVGGILAQTDPSDACMTAIAMMPPCAYSCISSAAGDSSLKTKCQFQDVACQCTQSADLQSVADPCVAANCPSDVDQFRTAASSICQICITATATAAL